MNVICPGCGESYHETTKLFTDSRPAHGAMFALKPLWVERGWSAFPENEGMAYGALECPGCLTLYCNSAGYIRKMEGPWAAAQELRPDITRANFKTDNTPPMTMELPDKESMAEGEKKEMVCGKCGKEYKRPDFFKNHVKKCGVRA